jgi:DNA-directed RNA polymerase specialized sigma24 family protein
VIKFDFDNDTLRESYRFLCDFFLQEGLAAEHAEELTNDTLVKAIKRRGDRGSMRCTPGSSTALLGRIAESALCDFLRTREGQRPASRHEVSPIEASAS